MHVNITGSTSTVRKEANAASFFYASILIPKLHYNITVDINFKRGFKRTTGLLGCCEYEDDDYEKPKTYNISIESAQPKEDLILTLAHEFVHVKQYRTGELRDYLKEGLTHCRWQGNRFCFSKLEYWDYPWEIEAYGKERGLYCRFLEKYK